jgi:hypothetical protein
MPISKPVWPGRMAGREPPRAEDASGAGGPPPQHGRWRTDSVNEPVPAIQAIQPPLRGPGNPPDALDPPRRRARPGKRRRQTPVSQSGCPGIVPPLNACKSARRESEARSYSLDGEPTSFRPCPPRAPRQSHACAHDLTPNQHRCSPCPIDAHPQRVSIYGGGEHLWSRSGGILHSSDAWLKRRSRQTIRAGA